MLEHNRKESEHNRGIFWEIPKSILGKFSSIIDGGLIIVNTHAGHGLLGKLCSCTSIIDAAVVVIYYACEHNVYKYSYLRTYFTLIIFHRCCAHMHACM